MTLCQLTPHIQHNFHLTHTIHFLVYGTSWTRCSLVHASISKKFKCSKQFDFIPKRTQKVILILSLKHGYRLWSVVHLRSFKSLLAIEVKLIFDDGIIVRQNGWRLFWWKVLHFDRITVGVDLKKYTDHNLKNFDGRYVKMWNLQFELWRTRQNLWQKFIFDQRLWQNPS